MNIVLQLILIFLGITTVILAMSWIFVPPITGLPWIPTHRKRIHKALELSDLAPDEIFYDLGSGDGRVLILAARLYRAKAVGIELSPAHCVLAWLRILLSGLSNRVSVRCGNFYKIGLEDADVIFAYLTPDHATRLRPQLEKQLRPGARVVTISADMKGWEPTAFDSEDLVFLYHMPPKPGSLGSFMAKKDSDLPRH